MRSTTEETKQIGSADILLHAGRAILSKRPDDIDGNATRFLQIWNLISKADQYIRLLAEKNPAFRQFAALVSPGQGLVQLSFSADDTQETYAWKVVRNMLVMIAKINEPGSSLTKSISVAQVVQLAKMLPLLKGFFPEEYQQSLIQYFQDFFKDRAELPGKSLVEEDYFYVSDPVQEEPSIKKGFEALSGALKKVDLLPAEDLAKLKRIVELLTKAVTGDFSEQVSAAVKLLKEVSGHLWDKKPVFRLQYDPAKPEAYNHQLSVLNQLISALRDIFIQLDSLEARFGAGSALSKPLNDFLESFSKFEIILPDAVPSFLKERLEAILPQSSSIRDFLHKKRVLHENGKAFYTIRLNAAEQRLKALKEKREKLRSELTPTLLKFHKLCHELYEYNEVNTYESYSSFDSEEQKNIKKYLLENNLLPEGFDVDFFFENYKRLDPALIKNNTYTIWNILHHFGSIGNSVRSLDHEITNTVEFILRFDTRKSNNERIQNVLVVSELILKNVNLVLKKTNLKREDLFTLLKYQESVSKISASYALLQKGAISHELRQEIIEQYTDLMTIYDRLIEVMPLTCLKLFNLYVRRITTHSEILFPEAAQALAKRRQPDAILQKYDAKKGFEKLLEQAKALEQNIDSRKEALSQESLLQKASGISGWLLNAAKEKIFGVSVAVSPDRSEWVQHLLQEFKDLEKNIEERIALLERNAEKKETDLKIKEITKNLYEIRVLVKRLGMDPKPFEDLWTEFTGILKKESVGNRPSPVLENAEWQEALGIAGDLPASPNSVEVDLVGMIRAASKAAQAAHEGLGALIDQIILSISAEPKDSPWRVIERVTLQDPVEVRLGDQPWKFSPAHKDTTESAYLRKLLEFLHALYRATDPKVGLIESLREFPWRQSAQLLQSLAGMAIDPRMQEILRNAVSVLNPIFTQVGGLFSPNAKQALQGILEKMNDAGASKEEKFLGSALQSGMIPLPTGFDEYVSRAMLFADSRRKIEMHQKALKVMEKDLLPKVKVPYLLPSYVPSFLRWPFALVTAPIAGVCNLLAAPYNGIAGLLNRRKTKPHTDAIEQAGKNIVNILSGMTNEELAERSQGAIQEMAENFRKAFFKLDELSARYGVSAFKAASDKLTNQINKQANKFTKDPGLITRPCGKMRDHFFLIDRLLKEKELFKLEEKNLFLLKEKWEQEQDPKNINLRHAVNSSEYMLKNLEAAIQEKEGIVLKWMKDLNGDFIDLIKSGHIEEFKKLSMQFLDVYSQLELEITAKNRGELEAQFDQLYRLLHSSALLKHKGAVSQLIERVYEIRSRELERAYFAGMQHHRAEEQDYGVMRAQHAIDTVLSHNSQILMPHPQHAPQQQATGVDPNVAPLPQATF